MREILLKRATIHRNVPSDEGPAGGSKYGEEKEQRVVGCSSRVIRVRVCRVRAGLGFIVIESKEQIAKRVL